MHISTFFYAEAAQVDTFNSLPAAGVPQLQQRLHVFQPMHVLTPDFVPCMYSFVVVFGILDMDMSTSHTFRITFHNPAGEVLIDTTEQTIPRNSETASTLPIHMQGILINMEFRNVPFKANGEYYTAIFVDGEEVNTYPLWVRGKEQL